jgi:hypothetical protein
MQMPNNRRKRLMGREESDFEYRVRIAFERDVLPLLTKQKRLPCGCVILEYSCRVLSQCCAHANRLIGSAA